jgi:hypothetical protein
VLEYDPKDPEKTRLFLTYTGFIVWCAASKNAYAPLLRRYCTRFTADIHNGDGGQYITKIVERELAATGQAMDVGDDVNSVILADKGEITEGLAYKVETFFKAIHGKSGFCIDFDNVWTLLDYGNRRNPVDRLVADFVENVDYVAGKFFDLAIFHRNRACLRKHTLFCLRYNESSKTMMFILTAVGGGNKPTLYYITVDCFKSFCMESNPRNKTISRAVRRYYLDLEKKVLDGDEATIIRMFGNRDARLGTKTAVTVTSVSRDDTDLVLMQQHLKDTMGQIQAMQSQLAAVQPIQHQLEAMQTQLDALSAAIPAVCQKPRLYISQVLVSLGFEPSEQARLAVGTKAVELCIRNKLFRASDGFARVYYEEDRELLEEAVRQTPNLVKLRE